MLSYKVNFSIFVINEQLIIYVDLNLYFTVYYTHVPLIRQYQSGIWNPVRE